MLPIAFLNNVINAFIPESEGGPIERKGDEYECLLCARSGRLMILKTMMSQPSFIDRSLATNDVIDYFCLNREALRIAS